MQTNDEINEAAEDGDVYRLAALLRDKPGALSPISFAEVYIELVKNKKLLSELMASHLDLEFKLAEKAGRAR